MEPFIQSFSLFSKYQNLLQVFSTRAGGFSKAPYDSLNLGMHSGDDKETVAQNRRLFFKQLQIPEDRLVFPEQVHSANVHLVQKPGVVPACDALITSEKDLFLTIQTADCFPVFYTTRRPGPLESSIPAGAERLRISYRKPFH